MEFNSSIGMLGSPTTTSQTTCLAASWQVNVNLPRERSVPRRSGDARAGAEQSTVKGGHPKQWSGIGQPEPLRWLVGINGLPVVEASRVCPHAMVVTLQVPHNHGVLPAVDCLEAFRGQGFKQKNPLDELVAFMVLKLNLWLPCACSRLPSGMDARAPPDGF